MVYLIEEYKRVRDEILLQRNIQSSFYLFLQKKEINFELVGMEALAIKGYIGETIPSEKIRNIISVQNKKNQIDNNIFKLIGICLANNDLKEIREVLDAKFNSSSKEIQYLIYKAFPNDYKDKLLAIAARDGQSLISYLLDEECNIDEVSDEINLLIKDNIGVQELVLIEDFLEKSSNIHYTNLNSLELVNQIIDNFPEAIKKIKNRRKGKDVFEFKDEYDVQDILYLILKPVFPNLKEEDPIAKVGSNSTKIDLILRQEGILIEVKMIKESDSDESKFIKQLKEDIQSYHICQWMEHLICFVYDPFDKTKDRGNFYDLNGNQTIGGKSFDVDVIVLK